MVARLGILAALWAVAAIPQELLKPDVVALPPALVSGHLDCHVEKFTPTLDFFFRFEASYILSCPVRQFRGAATKVETILRVVPEGRYPVVLGSFYKLPSIPDKLRPTVHWNRVNAVIGTSEGFSVGEGNYEVDLLAFDDHHREFRHHWKVHAERSRAEQNVNMTMQPGTVAPLNGKLWTGEHRTAQHRQLTVLLNASPLNPYSRKLRAWDRAFLLGSLSSVLRGLSYSSVRLVAFNLDQQCEIFHSNHFVETEMPQLETAMQNLELGTVSIETLNRTDGWIDLLHSFTHEERVREDASDAVIFLGPWSRLDAQPDRLTWNDPDSPKTHFYNIVFYNPAQRGSEFPDGIQRLTKKQDGISYRIHSPAELAEALQKLNSQLQQPPQQTSASR